MPGEPHPGELVELEPVEPGAWYAFELPWPPSVNDYWKPGGRGVRFLTKRAKQYRHDVFYLAKAQTDANAGPLLGRLRAVVQLSPPRALGDIDNVLKPILDGLEAARVFENDRQVKRLEVDILAPIRGGSVAVYLQSLKD